MPILVPPASQGKQCTCQENSEDYSREAGLPSLLGHPRPGSFVFSNKIKLNGILKRLICSKIANLRGLSAVFLKIPVLGGSFVSSLFLLLALVTAGIPVLFHYRILKIEDQRCLKRSQEQGQLSPLGGE